MSELFQVTVRGVSGQRAQLAVKAIHPDAGPVGKSATWLKKNASAYVKSVSLARGVLEVEATDPAWVSHLVKGMKWETPAWDAGPADKRAPRKPSSSAGHSSDPTAGFKVKALKDVGSFRIKRGPVPIHGVNRYVPDPILEPSPGSARKLVGEPVVLIPKRGQNLVGVALQAGREGIYLYEESASRVSVWDHEYADLKGLGRAWLK